MTLEEAKVLCDEIKAYGLHCTVPTARKREPEIRFVRVEMAVDLYSREEWLAYKKKEDKRREAALRREERYLDRSKLPTTGRPAKGRMNGRN